MLYQKMRTVAKFGLISSHLSLGLRTFMAIPLISGSPHLSGPDRPPTSLSQFHPRCLSNGIMARGCGSGKGK